MSAEQLMLSGLHSMTDFAYKMFTEQVEVQGRSLLRVQLVSAQSFHRSCDAEHTTYSCRNWTILALPLPSSSWITFKFCVKSCLFMSPLWETKPLCWEARLKLRLKKSALRLQLRVAGTS